MQLIEYNYLSKDTKTHGFSYHFGFNRQGAGEIKQFLILSELLESNQA